MDSGKYNRNEKKDSSSINDEIQKILKKNGEITHNDFNNLRNKYGDDSIVDEILTTVAEKQSKLYSKAKKFAALIREKYNNTSTPYHMLLEKAHKYKVKYKLTEVEFSEFQRIFEQELAGLKSHEIIRPQTNLMKVLGNISMEMSSFKKKLSDDDSKYLQEILKLYASTRSLQAQVLLQSFQYEDCDLLALTGNYNKDLHQMGSHVHPVIAALFLPKFNVVDTFFLFSNIAGIVKSRYNSEPLQSRPDFEVFYALTTDPNDVVCDSSSSMRDLLNRAQLQTQLWTSVLHLRNGQYYNNSFKDFLSSVDMCRLNKQDTPDLLYGRFDGVIIKRLLSAFSFRPTIVATTPVIMNSIALNPYTYNSSPVVTSVPMINMRLPPISTGSTLQLKDAIEQTQLFLENGAIVPRNTSLIWSRGILVFYVDRRANFITYNNHMSLLSMNVLPSSVAINGFEKINKNVVIVHDSISIRDEEYTLRSVVISETSTNTITGGVNVVLGSSALIIEPANLLKNTKTRWLYYDPYGPSKYQQPITEIYHSDPDDPDRNFLKKAQETGNVFIYASSGTIDEKQILSW